jgi:hypothetical protein
VLTHVEGDFRWKRAASDGSASVFNLLPTTPVKSSSSKEVKRTETPLCSQAPQTARRLDLPGALKAWRAALRAYPAEARNRSSRLWRGPLWTAAAWEATALESFASGFYESAERAADRAWEVLSSAHVLRTAVGGAR